MSTPCIITVAINGSVARKADTPAVPISVAEMIESTHESFDAGASIVHIHARDPDERSSSNPLIFLRAKEGIQKHCPGMIIPYSTGARGRELSQRGAMLDQRPDMASLATGSVNFRTSVDLNPPDFIDELAKKILEFDVKAECEVFDLAMLYNARDLLERGLLKPSPHVQFVLGVRNAQPARREILEFEVSELKKIMPDATWAAAGVGRHQLDVNRWTLELGGHCRTGIEDNIRWDKTRLARSNAELVSRVAELCKEYGRQPATAQEARDILCLRSVT
jgi:3-keto-5-aminohexanoate cleavage enzyme